MKPELRHPDVYGAPDGWIKQQIIRILEAVPDRIPSQATVSPRGNKGFIYFIEDEPVCGFMFFGDRVVILDAEGRRLEPDPSKWFTLATRILGIESSEGVR